MTSDDVKALVANALAAWRPPPVALGDTVGKPWSPERYGEALERLRATLVTPYEQRFVLRETDDPDHRRSEGEATYWVVAATKDMFLWYDAACHEFGVGEPGSDVGVPVSIGLRGDIVGSFSAW